MGPRKLPDAWAVTKARFIEDRDGQAGYSAEVLGWRNKSEQFHLVGGSAAAAACAMSFAVAIAVSGPACSAKKKTSEEGAGAGKVAASKGSGAKVATPASKAHIKIPSNEPRALNPLLEVRANRANMLIFEGLVGLDRGQEPIGRLAESWKLSEDKKTLTFALRKGVTWSDGKPFTAKDVSFTFSALRSLKDGQTLWAAFMVDVDRVETPDDHTVVVHYTKPYAPALMTWTMGILPEHVYASSINSSEGGLENSEGNLKPVGTGPYKLSRWDLGKRLTLVANETWWHGTPKIGRVELVFERGELLEDLAEGKLDFVDIPDNAKWVTETKSPEFLEANEATTISGSLFRVIAWNMRRKPFDNPKVREALTYALNRQRVVEDLLLGQGQLLSAPLFPGMFGVDSSIPVRRFDLSRAAALLDEAGLKAGKDGRRFGLSLLTVETYRKTVNEEMFATYRRDLAAIGVELKVEYLSYSDGWLPRVAEKRDFDAAFFGWLPEIPDPDPYTLLHSSQANAGRQNFAGYASAEADALLEAARAATDRDERRASYEKLNAVLNRDLPYTVAYSPFRHYAWSRRVRGVAPADVGEFARLPGLANWWIQE